MNFLFDHDVPKRVGDVVRQEGHSVVMLREVLPLNTPDAKVLAYANDHEQILVTCNRDDFLALADSMPYYGIIILIRRESRLAESSALLRLLRSADESGLVGNINFA